MSLCKRLIARLDVKGNKLIKAFDLKACGGDPLKPPIIMHVKELMKCFHRCQLVVWQKQSYRNSAGHNKGSFVPITAGGGIRSVSDAAKLLASGADKIAINSEALKRPQLITELATEFGSQCVVASIQARRITTSQWEAMGEAGRERSGKDLIAWLKETQDLGAGEILLTSIDQDGTCHGPDHALIKKISEEVSVPLIVGGGFSSISDVNKVFQEDSVGGISIGAALHKKILQIESCKEKLAENTYPIRHSQPHRTTTSGELSGLQIGIIDYGMGNQQSLINAIEYLGAKTVLSDQWDALSMCNLLMLPGVGAFPEGIKKLRERGLIKPLIKWGQADKPLIGICLGMQMLFEKGEEFEITEGLGLLPGTVKKMHPSTNSNSSPLPLPHMGWNQIIAEHEPEDWPDSIDQYFVHSYSARDVDQSMILHSSRYGDELIVASIKSKKIFGFQFHPERSGEDGLHLLKTTILHLLNT